MPNRVAELESAVAQLQATVDGLRGELVDANERIRALERELETDEDTGGTAPQANEQRSRSAEEQTDGGTSSVDDIIVA